MALRSASHARRTAAYSFQVDACLLKQRVGFRQFDKSCLGTVNEFVRSNGLPLTIWQSRGTAPLIHSSSQFDQVEFGVLLQGIAISIVYSVAVISVTSLCCEPCAIFCQIGSVAVLNS
jgi:hypothetical protein